MTTKMRINLNPIIALDELKPVLKLHPYPSVALLMLTFPYLWRSQYTELSKGSFQRLEEVQGTATQKFIASSLLTSHKMVLFILYGIAITKSLFTELSDYTETPTEKRPRFFTDRIQTLIAEGDAGQKKAKILTPSQLSDAEAISTHRRGLANQTRGKFQAAGIYSPQGAFTGAGMGAVTWEIFTEAFVSLASTLGLNLEEDLQNYLRNNTVQGGNSITENLAAVLRHEVLAAAKSKVLRFDDGAALANCGDQNLAPLEQVFSGAISRPLPVTHTLPAKPLDLTDPFLRAAKSYFPGKGLVSASMEGKDPSPPAETGSTPNPQRRGKKKRKKKGGK
jgi:hypothetical protein